ncbi:MAG: hypothetical protein NTV80_01520 [Verrucomicrobia bacterium]|nr:hypothetical protein [Verrucomicrobiota bacterium]
MNDTDFLAKAMRYQDGVLTPEEIATLEVVMRGDPTKRQLFAETQLRSMALHDRFRQEAFQSSCGFSHTPEKKRITWITRPIASMAAGLAIGLFSASLVWAISAPKATTERLFSLINGSFGDPRLDRSFPHQTGVWSGDEAIIADGKLRFIATGSDSNDPNARAISCDVFQLVDLRPLRHLLSQEGDSVLELSSNFLDARPHNTKPSVTFFCQLYLFKGDPASLHQSWPQSITDTLSSGSAQVTTLGTDAKGTRTLTAKCLVPAEADFAVIQIAARPNLRPAKLESLFADDVKLTLKTQPSLPVRIVQR